MLTAYMLDDKLNYLGVRFKGFGIRLEGYEYSTMSATGTTSHTVPINHNTFIIKPDFI